MVDPCVGAILFFWTLEIILEAVHAVLRATSIDPIRLHLVSQLPFAEAAHSNRKWQALDVRRRGLSRESNSMCRCDLIGSTNTNVTHV